MLIQKDVEAGKFFDNQINFNPNCNGQSEKFDL